jgi:hypothetical protein
MAAAPTNDEPPLVDVKVTNPLTYIKRWWARIIGKEGIDFRFRVRPLTAIAIALIITTVAFGLGSFVLPFSIPFFKYNPKPIALPTPDPWRETAFTGTLQYSSQTVKYYLLTSSSEAITLDVPNNVNLEGSVGRRIFAAGKYNKTTRILIVADAKDLEVLPKNPVPIPTTSPSPSPTPTVNPTPTPTPEETASPSP